MTTKTDIKKIKASMLPVTTLKKLKYTPMTLGAYNKLRGWKIPKDESPSKKGFLVEYEPSKNNPPNMDGFDGYISWSPDKPLIRAIEDYEKLKKNIGSSSKTLNATSSADLDNTTKVYGNPDLWICVGKASNQEEGWMKSTKALQLDKGCLVQVSTQQGNNVAEAITFVPGAVLRNINGVAVLT